MSGLRRAAEEYLAIRRAVGYKLKQEGRLLADFVGFMEQRELQTQQDCHITVDAALAWATLPAGVDVSWWAKRLSVVRCFAKYLRSVDIDTQVPPTDLLARSSARPTPFLLSPADIAALMSAAGRLATPLRAATFETLIGLMASTGIRTGEAMNLDRDDVDPDSGMVTVRDSKFGKSRMVSLHPSAASALAEYARRRDQLCPNPTAPSFLLSGIGSRLNHTNTSTTFARLVIDAGLVIPPGRARPSPYDLRHSFVVATVMSWHAAGFDVQSRLPALSTYLGHINPANTYWYLHAAPELMQHVARRLETSQGGTR
jgi:integrase/recombinase XerD